MLLRDIGLCFECVGWSSIAFVSDIEPELFCFKLFPKVFVRDLDLGQSCVNRSSAVFSGCSEVWLLRFERESGLLVSDCAV